MAAWWTVLKAVPWRDVIAHAPAVAQGARKLWKTVRRSSREALADSRHGASPESEVSRLREQMREVQEQQVNMAALLETLAEQNEQLVRAVGNLRVWLRVLGVACAGLTVAVAVALMQ